MADAILIIDISKDSVRAGVFSASKNDPLEYFSVPLSGPEAHGVTEGVKEGLSSVVSMVKGKGYGITRALASIPASDMSIRIVTVPFEDRKKITEVLPFELGGLLHIDVEHVVIDAIHIGEGKVLAVALEKALLKDYLDAFHSLGIDPYWIGSGLFALPSLLNRIYPSSGIKAFINRDSLTISEDGNIRFFKPVKRLEGIKLGLAYIDAEGIGINEVYFTGWRHDELKPLLPGIRTIEEIRLPGDYPAEGAAILALAHLVKSVGLEDFINFRKGEFEYTKEKTAARRSLKITAVAVISAAVILGADIYVRYLSMSREVSGYTEVMRASYLQLFPAERNVTDPAYQLEAKLKALEKESDVLGGGYSVLKIMAALARAGADVGARFNEVSIGEGRLLARGEAPSFEEANRLRDRLAGDPLFKDARVSDVRAKTGGGAIINITASLR